MHDWCGLVVVVEVVVVVVVVGRVPVLLRVGNLDRAYSSSSSSSAAIIASLYSYSAGVL